MGWRGAGVGKRGTKGAGSERAPRQPERDAPPHCGLARHRRHPAKPRPNTGVTHHRPDALQRLSPTQTPAARLHHRPDAHRQPYSLQRPPPSPGRHPPTIKHPPAAQCPTGGQTFSRLLPLQSSTHQRRSHHLRPPTTGQPSAAARHRHNALPLCHSAPSAAQHRRRPSPTQRPLCHSLSPPLGSHYPPLGGPSGTSPNGRQKRSPSAGRGLNHLSMTNPQRGYLFSFRMRIACSRIVVSSNVTMPPSGPGSK